MDVKYKQLEQELSALSKAFSELGVRLAEAAKEVTAPGMNPSEKLVEQISAARASFESVRSAIHGHATAMLVSPLPKLGELVSLATIDSLFKAAVVAEEARFSIDSEREKALAILGRVLSIVHRETADFKPLHECQAKIGELRAAVSNVVWPHRHPESESIIGFKHPTTDFLHFVEHLDQIDDERWMALEATITNSFGKPLFVAASRGKLAVGTDGKSPMPVAAKPAVPEKPGEKKIVVERAPERPAPVPAASVPLPKPMAPPSAAPAAPVAATLVAADRTPQKPVLAPSPTPVVNPVTAAPVKPMPATVPAPAPPQPAVATSTPVVPQAAAPVAPTPAVAPVAVPRPPAPGPPAAAVVSTPAPPVPTPAMQTSTVSTQVPSAPTATAPNGINSLAALATATEPPEKKPVSAPADALDKQRREPRLATPAPQLVSKPESKPQDGQETMRQEAEGLAGDGSQRPQRWGFWRGNR